MNTFFLLLSTDLLKVNACLKSTKQCCRRPLTPCFATKTRVPVLASSISKLAFKWVYKERDWAVSD